MPSLAQPISLKGRTMRTYMIGAAATCAVLAATLGACSDGSQGIGGGGGPGSSSAGTSPMATAGTAPSAGTGTVVGTGGTGTTPTGGSTGTTGGDTTVSTGGSGGGSVIPPVGGSTTGGTSSGGGSGGGAPPAGGTGSGGSGSKSGPFKVLIISTTLEFAHDSIPDCQQMVADLGKADPANPWTTKIETDDLVDFTAAGLADYGLIFSCNPTGRVFSGNSKVKDPKGAMMAFQTFIETDGKAFAGVHSASDFENTNGFPWFTNTLMGAYFQTHDGDGTSGSVVADMTNKDHPVLANLSGTFATQDEWYKMNRDIGSQTGFKILQRLAADQRPLTWVKDVGLGRMFYTVRGHNKARYKEEPFRTLVKNGIYWVMRRTG